MAIIKTIDDIRANANEGLIGLYLDKRLVKWLKNYNYLDYAAQVEQIDCNLSRKDIFSELAKIFELNIDVNSLATSSEEQLCKAQEYYDASDYENAMIWYTKAAEQYSAHAQCFLGFMYYCGEGVTKDLQQAIYWYTKAAEQGYAYAQYTLGFMYYCGEGVTKDLQQALYWYTQAVEQGADRLNIDEETKNSCIKNITVIKLQQAKLNMLIVGATGSGKSTTINAIFNLDVATVGDGIDPETMDIQKYQLHDNLVLWDTPGLGDSIEKDKQHIAKIVSMLQKKDTDGNALIDLVLVIIDASSRYMETSYSLINDTIIPNMKEKDRIIIALNQCEIAMRGKGFDYDKNKPNPELLNFLEDKLISVKRRIYESSNYDCNVAYYSAETGYNVTEFFDLIIDNIPTSKRYLG